MARRAQAMGQTLAARLWLVVCVLGCLAGCSSGRQVMEQANLHAPAGRGFLTRTLVHADRTRSYVVFVPHHYTPEKKWPTILFLHGLFESGGDGRHQLSAGLAPAIAKRAESFGFIVVFPQSPWGWEADAPATDDAIAALDDVTRDYSVDTDRVILSGISMGGKGVWDVAAKYPDRFAALVPMCAFASEKNVPRLLRFPIWAFHNTGDFLVNVADSVRMVTAINKAGGHARYTQYEAVGHDVWEQAFEEPEIFPWMLQQHRSDAGLVRANTSG